MLFFILIFELVLWHIGKSSCLGDGMVDMQHLKCCEQMLVRVRLPPQVQCNDLEISDGTDAMYEMETFEARTKVLIRYKPYRHYIKLVP